MEKTEWKTGRDSGFHAAFLSDRINLYDARQPLLQKSRWESTRERVIYVFEILNEQFLGAVFSPPPTWNWLFPILEIICHRKKQRFAISELAGRTQADDYILR